MAEMADSILYEDNHVLVAVKPPNMLSQADSTRDPDILTLLKEYLREKYHKPGNVYLGLVHRLDRPVGGLMVFARTSKAAARLDAGQAARLAAMLPRPRYYDANPGSAALARRAASIGRWMGSVTPP